MICSRWFAAAALLLLLAPTLATAEDPTERIDLTSATVVVQPNAGLVEQTAARVLLEEVAKRTGLTWKSQEQMPARGAVIVLATGVTDAKATDAYPARSGQELAEAKPEGFRLLVGRRGSGEPIVWIRGSDGPGVLYGVGAFLRKLVWQKGQAQFPAAMDLATAPRYAIRGHQLGYRPRANSWDGWNVAQMEQYIRDLALFGANAIENIPQPEPGRKLGVPAAEMHRQMGEICRRYGMAYWLWMPAEVDLKDPAQYAKQLKANQATYQGCAHLTGVFVPGGDPGANAPEILLPFLAESAKDLMAVHPEARTWLSLQWFNEAQIRWIFDYIQREKPKWLGGLCGGPSGPPLPMVRAELPAEYPLRDYPDLTHNKLCQYPVSWWDPAFVRTLGREAINPRPVQFAAIHNWNAAYTNGFLSYSDGCHDDVNKIIWTARSWNPEADVRDVLVDYARVFFASRVAEQAADGILGLERNWQGPARTNGGIEGTLLLWQQLEQQAPELAGNWRWQMCLVRAYYDAYVRARLIYEQGLEQEAYVRLAAASVRGPEAAMDDALAVLQRADQPVRPELRKRILELCDALYQSICLQSSVKQHEAEGGERGAFLDYVDVPLNNRWWLEDEFAKIRKLGSNDEKIARLEVLRTWENPGEGSYYDDLGNVANAPHLTFATDENTDPLMTSRTQPTFWWLDNGFSRTRLSWQWTLHKPEAVVYEGLDPQASYVVRTTGYGQPLLRINGQRVEPTQVGRELGQFSLFQVPAAAVATRRLVLTWDVPEGDEDLPWRQQSRLAEVWLLKQPR